MSYIVPRDKPKRCTQPKCRFMDRNTLDCRLQGKSWESFEEQYEHCPLIEIPAQPDVPDINVGDMISRQAAIDALRGYLVGERCPDDGTLTCRLIENEVINKLPPAQPERIVRCKDCKHWIPYDWMFSEVWQSKNIADYPEDEIGCNLCDMAMKANDFCSRAERREVTT